MRTGVVFLATVVAFLVSKRSVLSQSHRFPSYWPTPVPTETTSTGSALPDGFPLIKAMYTAMRRYGSVHVAISGQFLEPGVERGTLQATEDTSVRTDVAHYVGRTQVIALSKRAVDYTSVEENIAVKHVQATRGEAGEIPEAWVCERVPGKLSASYFVVYEWNHLTEVRNQGAAIVDGRMTWHVTAFATWKQGKQHRMHYEPVDYYIAPSDHTLVRELVDAATNGPDKLIPYTQVFDYSAYGEPVFVALPKACRKLTQAR